MRDSERWATMLVALAAASCVDTRGALDEFGERFARTHDAGTGADATGPCALPEAGEVVGSFLLAISPSFSPKTPILFTARISEQARSVEELSLGLELVALSAADRTTPVGSPLPSRDFTLRAGDFLLDLGRLEIDGQADPIIPNAPISGSLALSGRLCSARSADAASAVVDFLCGAASGQVTAPAALDLGGSTWAAPRITDPGALPPIALDCARGAPDPL